MRSIHQLRIYDEFILHDFVPFSLCLPFVLFLFGSYYNMSNKIIYISSNNITKHKENMQQRVAVIGLYIEFLCLVPPPYFFPFNLCLNFVLFLFGSNSDTYNDIVYRSSNNITSQQQEQRLKVCVLN